MVVAEPEERDSPPSHLANRHIASRLAILQATDADADVTEPRGTFTQRFAAIVQGMVVCDGDHVEARAAQHLHHRRLSANSGSDASDAVGRLGNLRLEIGSTKIHAFEQVLDAGEGAVRVDTGRGSQRDIAESHDSQRSRRPGTTECFRHER